MKKTNFISAFTILFLATLLFVIFKNVLPQRIFSESSQLTENVIVDSLMLEAVTQTEEKKIDTIPEKIVVKDTITHLFDFFEKLEELEETGNGHIRIGYFGDSMTDGDLIVQDFRQLFQEAFGGEGVGFVPINSESANSRGSVRHTYSNNWKTQSFVNVKKPVAPFGVSGQVFFVKKPSQTWVKYEAPYKKEMPSPVLFFGKSNSTQAQVEIICDGDTTKIMKPLNADKLLNTIKLSESNVKSVKLNFIEADSIPFYGINFDTSRGVQVDNFSSRGNSGLPLSLFNANLMHHFDQKLGGYDLLVLHFGANVLNYGSLNYSWYEKAMEKVINQLRVCFPKASILVISTADKSSKTNMEMKTDKAVVPLATSQQRYAQKTQSGFINLYQLMGGNGSMKKWVEATPPMASKDYTHFNARGAKKVAQLIYDELMIKYAKYKETSNKDRNKLIENQYVDDMPDSVSDSIIIQKIIDSVLVKDEKIKDSLKINF